MKRINKNTHMHIELVYLQFQLHPFLVGTVNVDRITKSSSGQKIELDNVCMYKVSSKKIIR